MQISVSHNSHQYCWLGKLTELGIQFERINPEAKMMCIIISDVCERQSKRRKGLLKIKLILNKTVGSRSQNHWMLGLMTPSNHPFYRWGHRGQVKSNNFLGTSYSTTTWKLKALLNEGLEKERKKCAKKGQQEEWRLTLAHVVGYILIATVLRRHS